MQRYATVDYVHPFFSMYLRLCGDITSEEIRIVHILVMSFRLEEFLVKFVRLCLADTSCSSFHNLVDHWSYRGGFGASSVVATCLDQVQSWKFVSDFLPLRNFDVRI